MAVFKTKAFARFARKARISDETLASAARGLRLGGIHADLGGGVAKVRIARQGGGKSGGFRSIVVFRRDAHLFYIYGYAKSERANITDTELIAFRELADQYLNLARRDLDDIVAGGELLEVFTDE